MDDKPETEEPTQQQTEDKSGFQEERRDRASSRSSSSASDNSSESSPDVKDQKDTDTKRRVTSKSPPVRGSKSKSKSKSVSKEKQRSASRSGSRDGSESRRERSRKYKSDEKSESRPQGSRGGYQKYREGRDDSRSRSRSPYDRKPRQGQDKSRNPISKPTLDGPLWSFRQFMESQRYDVDPNKAQKVYEKYKKEHEDKQNQIFFAEHKHDEWFKEKYDVVHSERLKEEKRAEARVNAEKFLENLNDNVYQSLNLNYEDYEHKSTLSEYTPKPNNEQFEEEKEGAKAFNNFTEISLETTLDITGPPFFGFDPNSQTLFTKSIPKSISRWDLTEAFRKLTGFVSLSLSESLKSQEFTRFGWILFDTEDNCNKAYEYLKTLNIKGYAFNIVKSRSQRKSVKICENMNKERIETDIALSKQLIEALDAEKDIHLNSATKLTSETDPAKRLDLQILYLRKVHSYCFYCAAEYVDERMLAAKCGPIHLRRLKLETEEASPDLPDCHKRISEIIRVRIEESSHKPKRTLEEIEKKAEEEFDAELKAKCEKVSVKHGNWPCKYCHKIFKEEHYVLKHIKTKHPEDYGKIREKKMYENYANDKNKITAGFNPSNDYQRRGGYQRPQGQYGNRGGYNRNYRDRDSRPPNRPNYQYKDLDDPKVTQVRSSRPVINYGDL